MAMEEGGGKPEGKALWVEREEQEDKVKKSLSQVPSHVEKKLKGSHAFSVTTIESCLRP